MEVCRSVGFLGSRLAHTESHSNAFTTSHTINLIPPEVSLMRSTGIFKDCQIPLTSEVLPGPFHDVSIANQQIIRQNDACSTDCLCQTRARWVSDVILIGSITAVTVRLHCENSKTSVTVTRERHANKNIRNQCTVLTLFAIAAFAPPPA
jgi:hypothetical protein